MARITQLLSHQWWVGVLVQLLLLMPFALNKYQWIWIMIWSKRNGIEVFQNNFLIVQNCLIRHSFYEEIKKTVFFNQISRIFITDSLLLMLCENNSVNYHFLSFLKYFPSSLVRSTFVTSTSTWAIIILTELNRISLVSKSNKYHFCLSIASCRIRDK